MKLKSLLLVLAGNTLYALAIVLFLLPEGMITGGSTGLALAANHYLSLPLSKFLLLFNFSMLVLGAAILGRSFAFTTLVSTFYYPFILQVLQKLPIPNGLTSDRMLSTICGGLLIGFAIGIVIRTGASTGGMDVPPLILQKKLGIPVSVSLYGFDLVILLLQASFSDKENVLYGILLVLIYTVTLDKVLVLGTGQVKVEIISQEYKEINHAILRDLDRGSTLIQASTGYLHQNQPMVLTVMPNRELVRLNRLVLAVDPEAFLIISQVKEVKGHGFSLNKERNHPFGKS
ncbi:YitT family protein [Cuneatibacter sp. NSJ-177]|uniref:YitT family protein n=1 Tax=Cuneatibacter sp. NSJ-177 TaxID=2931401 RepID=UPI001FCFE3B4|nr:YitT family protein [Cuneatibacter sp. NSJ-177]MCJ7837240.1 YitT family protein [Cuneatibacter sp. NSJ-177]